MAMWRGSNGKGAGRAVVELAMIVGIDIAAGDGALICDTNNGKNRRENEMRDSKRSVAGAEAR
ncbi:hypothetical protein BPOR_1235g00010 [Botrytis porri]|uniref:Uncharacterized protein n=1 Tax=Botrytis porri TaxID=87229 RepID=A0A4Z1KCM3_9HELO|nr:hypothetical protein BPOR_1235g00010 [Botrytis porri]